jgi:hypothetical protein
MDANFVTELKKGQQNPIKLGWFSSSFYLLEEATTFENSIAFQGEKCFVTKIIF